MSVELAGRLLQSGIVPEGDVHAALHALVTDGIPLARALAESGDDVARIVERELARCDVPLAPSVRPVGSLVEALPLVMCERLLAIPVRLDSRTGTVDVAAVDPRDPHIAAEFEHALGAPVRLLRAPLGDLLTALADLNRAAPRRSQPPPPPDGGDFSPEITPAYGTRAPSVDRDGEGHPAVAQDKKRKPAFQSAPPIPLVRRSTGEDDESAEHEPVKTTSDSVFPKRPATNPGFDPPARETFGEDDEGEPVIGLYRSKPPPPMSVPPAPVEVVPDPKVPPAERLGMAEVAVYLEALEKAGTPDEVVDQLVEAMSVAADQVAVFAVRGGTFQGRACNEGISHPEKLRDIAIAVSTPSVFETAVQAGYYLGPLPTTEVHRQITTLLGETDGEVYLTPATVSGHPVLVVLAAGLSDAYAGSRWADQVTRAAGDALGRILRGKKRGG